MTVKHGDGERKKQGKFEKEAWSSVIAKQTLQDELPLHKSNWNLAWFMMLTRGWGQHPCNKLEAQEE